MHANHYFDTFIQAEIQRLEKTKPPTIGDTIAWTGPRKRGASLTPATDERRRITAEQLRILQAHTAYPVLVAIKEGIRQRHPKRIAERARAELHEMACDPVFLDRFQDGYKAIERLLTYTAGPNNLHYSELRVKLRQCACELERACCYGATRQMSEVA